MDDSRLGWPPRSGQARRAGAPLQGSGGLGRREAGRLKPNGRLLVNRALRPGGHLGLACFAAGAMGSEVDDAELYRDARLDGGLAYTPDALRWIFADLTEVELRRMRDEPDESPCFGEPFLWTALFRLDPRNCAGGEG